MVLKWKQGNVSGGVHKKALQGGTDSDGSPIFIGRAMHNGVNLPAKIIPSKQACYVAYGGAEVFVENFEWLAAKESKFLWEPASSGQIVPGAVPTGSDGGEELYIGRGFHEGSMTVGKIHPSHGCMYIPYNGQELPLSNYEVLVYKKFR